MSRPPYQPQGQIPPRGPRRPQHPRHQHFRPHQFRPQQWHPHQTHPHQSYPHQPYPHQSHPLPSRPQHPKRPDEPFRLSNPVGYWESLYPSQPLPQPVRPQFGYQSAPLQPPSRPSHFESRPPNQPGIQHGSADWLQEVNQRLAPGPSDSVLQSPLSRFQRPSHLPPVQHGSAGRSQMTDARAALARDANEQVVGPIPQVPPPPQRSFTGQLPSQTVSQLFSPLPSRSAIQYGSNQWDELINAADWGPLANGRLGSGPSKPLPTLPSEPASDYGLNDWLPLGMKVPQMVEKPFRTQPQQPSQSTKQHGSDDWLRRALKKLEMDFGPEPSHPPPPAPSQLPPPPPSYPPPPLPSQPAIDHGSDDWLPLAKQKPDEGGGTFRPPFPAPPWSPSPRQTPSQPLSHPLSLLKYQPFVEYRSAEWAELVNAGDRGTLVDGNLASAPTQSAPEPSSQFAIQDEPAEGEQLLNEVLASGPLQSPAQSPPQSPSPRQQAAQPSAHLMPEPPSEGPSQPLPQSSSEAAVKDGIPAWLQKVRRKNQKRLERKGRLKRASVDSVGSADSAATITDTTPGPSHRTSVTSTSTSAINRDNSPFMKLPAKIRFYIYRLIQPANRIIPLVPNYRDNYGWKSVLSSTTCKPPINLSICQESRKHSLKIYHTLPTSLQYVNYHKDVFLLEWPVKPEHRRQVEQNPFRRVRHLAIVYYPPAETVMNLKGQLEMELGIMSALETVSLIRYWVKAGSAKARTELVQYEVVRDVRSGNVVKGWRQVRKQAWADSERSGCWKRAGLLHREGVEVAEDHWLGYAMDDQVLGL